MMAPWVRIDYAEPRCCSIHVGVLVVRKCTFLCCYVFRTERKFTNPGEAMDEELDELELIISFVTFVGTVSTLYTKVYYSLKIQAGHMIMMPAPMQFSTIGLFL